MNIYVSNLSFNIHDDDLRDLFSPFGEVASAKIINDRATGKTRGFAFVEMPSDSDARKAITELKKNPGKHQGFFMKTIFLVWFRCKRLLIVLPFKQKQAMEPITC